MATNLITRTNLISAQQVTQARCPSNSERLSCDLPVFIVSMQIRNPNVSICFQSLSYNLNFNSKGIHSSGRQVGRLSESDSCLLSPIERDYQAYRNSATDCKEYQAPSQLPWQLGRLYCLYLLLSILFPLLISPSIHPLLSFPASRILIFGLD